jgi:hypothetical protein
MFVQKLRPKLILKNRPQNAIYKVLWNSEKGAWFDYDLLHQRQRLNFYASNVAPLWAECYPSVPHVFYIIAGSLARSHSRNSFNESHSLVESVTFDESLYVYVG